MNESASRIRPYRAFTVVNYELSAIVINFIVRDKRSAVEFLQQHEILHTQSLRQCMAMPCNFI